ncbi:DUF1566 domain-containing protein [Photobacterium sanctipauli]|uniref:DUF1566 domain-containing protein n=1 Tax=Photobacterium sanctipauli TaxID=1342794 RepID=A0A2T3NQR4_9GAMM|nr:DUF1566 domain-containing protein [Photobacterium sanctipauli]PSW18557.1 DUF1566 domain-containing protein [Photobacterium sanctipauli]
MKAKQLAVLPVAIALALSGCGGSSDSDSSAGGTELTYEVEAMLAAENVDLPFTACADLDRNWQCDSNEPKTESSQQTFSLESTDIKVKTSPLLVQGNLVGGALAAKSSGQDNILLATPAVGESRDYQINGITTMVVGEMLLGSNQAQAEAQVKANLEAMGLSVPTDLLTSGSEAQLAEVDQQIVNVLSRMTKRTESYDTLVAGTAKGLSIYGDDIKAGNLSDAQLEELAELGAIANRPANDTGLTKHLNLTTGEFSDQPDSGAPGQDAEYGLDATDGGFKFTKLDESGQAMPDDSENWYCIADERTGLVWERKEANASSYRDKGRLFAYESSSHKPHQAALDIASCASDSVTACTTLEYIEEMNKQGYCGKTNWRLPTLHEQFDLLDFGETTTDEAGNGYGLSNQFFDDLVLGGEDLPYGMYWSSTALRSDPGYTSGKQIPLLAQMTNVDDSNSLGEISAGYSLCEDGQAEECISPTVLTVRLVAE